jgi:hypothetical protein
MLEHVVSPAAPVSDGTYSHVGQEFIYMLKGSIEF